MPQLPRQTQRQQQETTKIPLTHDIPIINNQESIVEENIDADRRVVIVAILYLSRVKTQTYFARDSHNYLKPCTSPPFRAPLNNQYFRFRSRFNIQRSRFDVTVDVDVNSCAMQIRFTSGLSPLVFRLELNFSGSQSLLFTSGIITALLLY